MSRPEDLDVDALTAVVQRAFGTGQPFQLERTPDGTSTPVYRLVRGDELFFVRAAEHRDHPLDVEVEVHVRLRALGVAVPEVVYHEPFEPRLGRGVAILTAVPGIAVAAAGHGAERNPRSAGGGPLDLAEVYRAAGRDVARIESVPVDGFGFLSRGVRREGEERASWPLRAPASWPLRAPASSPLRGPASWPLRAPHRTGSGALLDGTEGMAPDRLLGVTATPERSRALERLQADADRLFGGAGPAVLVHGDVDPAHIFHLEGRYTGLIDLGEVRGATPGDDLGRFRLWVGEGPALSHLTAGYAELAALPDDHEHRGRALAVLLGVQQLGRWVARGGDAELERPTARRLAARVGTLLDQLSSAA